MNIYIEYAKTFHRLLPAFDVDLIKNRRRFFQEHDDMNFFEVPIFIISFNRLSYLKGIVNKLEKMGYKNLKIIDNASTYPSLLEYYKTTPYEVFKMNENLGHMVFWKSQIFEKYRQDLYVVTDPDVLPTEDCPNNFVEVFYKYLKKYPRIKKAGFSLKIDDIPLNAILYKSVMGWEKAYCFFKIPWRKAYSSDIDTTFALYIPDSLDISRHFLTAIRVAEPYSLKHLPWYKVTSDEEDEEELYYISHRTNGFWDTKAGGMTDEGISAGWSKGRMEL